MDFVPHYPGFHDPSFVQREEKMGHQRLAELSYTDEAFSEIMA